MGIKNSIILWFRKSYVDLWKKRLKRVFDKKTHNFWTLPFFWWKFHFFVNIFFQVHFVTKLCLVFQNLHKIIDFLIPLKTHFEAKNFWTLLIGFWHFYWDKNLHYCAKSQNRKKCLFYFDLKIFRSFNPGTPKGSFSVSKNGLQKIFFCEVIISCIELLYRR